MHARVRKLLFRVSGRERRWRKEKACRRVGVPSCTQPNGNQYNIYKGEGRRRCVRRRRRLACFQFPFVVVQPIVYIDIDIYYNNRGACDTAVAVIFARCEIPIQFRFHYARRTVLNHTAHDRWFPQLSTVWLIIFPEPRHYKPDG